MGHINQMARWVLLIATVQWIVSLVEKYTSTLFLFGKNVDV